MTLPTLAKTRDVSVIIPTSLDTRLEWLKRRLNFLYQYGFQGQTLVGVWSGHAKAEELLAFCARLSPNIRVILQDGAIRFTARVLALSEHVTSKYIVQIGDDDFLLPDALEKLVGVLEHDARVVCAQGRTISINSDLSVPLQIRQLQMWPAPETDILNRFAQYCMHPGQVFHAMFRRADFIERYHWMDEAWANTDNHVWYEVIGEFFALVKGRFLIVDEIFIIRGKDANNTSRIMRANAGQFPLFLLSETFSPTYKFFEGQVFRLFASSGLDVNAPETRSTILTGILSIIGAAAFNRRGPPPAEEVRLLEVLRQQPTHPTVDRLLRMILDSQPVAAGT